MLDLLVQTNIKIDEVDTGTFIHGVSKDEPYMHGDSHYRVEATEFVTPLSGEANRAIMLFSYKEATATVPKQPATKKGVAIDCMLNFSKQDEYTGAASAPFIYAHVKCNATSNVPDYDSEGIFLGLRKEDSVDKLKLYLIKGDLLGAFHKETFDSGTHDIMKVFGTLLDVNQNYFVRLETIVNDYSVGGGGGNLEKIINGYIGYEVDDDNNRVYANANPDSCQWEKFARVVESFTDVTDAGFLDQGAVGFGMYAETKNVFNFDKIKIGQHV